LLASSIAMPIDEASKYLCDVATFSGREVADYAEVEIGNPVVRGHEQVRGVEVGVVSPVDHDLSHEGGCAMDRQPVGVHAGELGLA
jgi:hypothetical protein